MRIPTQECIQRLGRGLEHTGKIIKCRNFSSGGARRLGMVQRSNSHLLDSSLLPTHAATIWQKQRSNRVVPLHFQSLAATLFLVILWQLYVIQHSSRLEQFELAPILVSYSYFEKDIIQVGSALLLYWRCFVLCAIIECHVSCSATWQLIWIWYIYQWSNNVQQEAKFCFLDLNYHALEVVWVQCKITFPTDQCVNNHNRLSETNWERYVLTGITHLVEVQVPTASSLNQNRELYRYRQFVIQFSSINKIHALSRRIPSQQKHHTAVLYSTIWYMLFRFGVGINFAILVEKTPKTERIVTADCILKANDVATCMWNWIF